MGEVIFVKTSSLDSLEHYGVKGMKWGVRRDQAALDRAAGRREERKAKRAAKKEAKKNAPNYRESAEKDYVKRGYSKSDAAELAARKDKIRKTAMIAGGVALTVGAVALARYGKTELMDTTLKKGAKTYHIARGEVTDLEKGRNFFVTIDKFDRKAYQWRLNNPLGTDRIERTFEAVKDIKIPNERKSKKMYEQFTSDPKVKKVLKENFGMEKVDYKKFVTMSPYFSAEETGRINEMAGKASGAKLWKDFQQHIMNEGYQGMLDANDRARGNGFNVERPTILFDAAELLNETGRTTLGKEMSIGKMMIPTVREAMYTMTNPTVAAVGASAVAGKAIDTKVQTSYLETYRKKHPNTKKTNAELIKDFKENGTSSDTFMEMAEYARRYGE